MITYFVVKKGACTFSPTELVLAMASKSNKSPGNLKVSSPNRQDDAYMSFMPEPRYIAYGKSY